jgi:hypothetical protein
MKKNLHEKSVCSYIRKKLMRKVGLAIKRILYNEK